MKKLVLKTVGITLVSLLMALAVTVFSLYIFSPLTLANLTNNIGLENISVKYYQKQYMKTRQPEDLLRLVEALDERKSPQACYDYTINYFIGNAFFNDYCQDDAEGKGAGAVKYGSGEKAREYFYNKGTVACFNIYGESQISRVGDCFRKYVNNYGYTDYNPCRAVLAETQVKNPQTNQYETKLTHQQLQYILSYLEGLSFSNQKFDEEEIEAMKARVLEDKQIINDFIIQKGE